jgi:hypothetical protein
VFDWAALSAGAAAALLSREVKLDGHEENHVVKR